MLWRAVLLAGLVYVLRNGVLRARELYADARALTWDGRAGALARIVGALPRPAHAWLGPFRFHPDPAVRARALDDPAPLFSIRPWEALGTGIVATVAYSNVLTLLQGFVADGLELRWLAALVFAPLAVGVIGLGVWRAVYAARVRRTSAAVGRRARPLPRCRLPARADPLVRPRDRRRGGRGARAGRVPPALGAARRRSRSRSSSAGSPRRPRPGSRPDAGERPRRSIATASLVAAGGMLAIWMGWLFFLRETAPVFPIAAELSKADRVAVDAVTWVPPEWLWLAVWHPLALLFALDELTAVLSAGLLAAPFAAWLVLRGRSGLRPGWALAAGGVAGAAYLVLLLVLRLGVHASVASETGATQEFRIGFFTWQATLAYAVECAVAAAVAIRIREDGALHGMLAAFTAGAVAACAIVGGIQLATCADAFSISSGNACEWVIDGGFTWQMFRQVAVQGLVYAIPAALLAALAMVGVRRLRARGSRPSLARAAG